MILKQISTPIAIVTFAWPIIFTYTAPANNAIITFIFYMFDLTITVNNARIMVYSEYKLLKGTDPSTFKTHMWLFSVILTKYMQLNCVWLIALSIHLYSPLYTHSHRFLLMYISMCIYMMLELTYQKCYKKWVISYGVLSTDDT